MGNALGFGSAESMGNVAVEHENICGRMGNALCGVCVGLVFFFGSIFLLGWNEFNYVRNQAILLKVDKEVVEAGCVPSSANADKAIWASCQIMRVYDFGSDSRVKSLGLSFSDKLEGSWFRAESHIFQWVEDKECETHSTAGGGKTKICTYDYNVQWVSSPVASSSFYCYPNWRSGCQRSGSEIQNTGSLPQALQQTIRAPDGQVGMGQSKDTMYLLNSGELGVFQSEPVSVESGQQASPLLPNKQVVVTGGGVQFSTYPGRDSIGDVRTTFTQSNIQTGNTQVSVIAKQRGTPSSGDVSLNPWDTKLPGSMSVVNWATLGSSSKSEMIKSKQSENGVLVIMLRFLGFILMVVGLQLVTGPIALMPQVVPCIGEMLGEVVGCALCCINSLISLALSLTVIGAAWLLARPLLGLGLLLVAAAAVFGAYVLRGKYRSARSPSMTQPILEDGAQFRGQPQQPQQIQVTCPQGVFPGQLLMVQCPDGSQRNVTVPVGVQPGQAFVVAL